VPLGATYLDEGGKEHPIVMGSYGIGPARIIAAAIEQRADERGIVWPRATAPWEIQLVSLAKSGEPEREAADRLYEELEAAGAEVLYDDRDAGPGEKLTDAELIGCPLRLVVGRRGLERGVVEAGERARGEEHELPVEEAGARALALLQDGDG
jgi:prolyl-tRNA synthetase